MIIEIIFVVFVIIADKGIIGKYHSVECSKVYHIERLAVPLCRVDRPFPTHGHTPSCQDQFSVAALH